MEAMMAFIRWLVPLVAIACSADGDTASGSRARCAEGGALTACSEVPQTPQEACWKLVDCGAVAIASSTNRFDWGECVDRIETSIEGAQKLIIHCIAASSCDALKVAGSPDEPNRDQMACFHLGGR